jgi:hypothetical protein
VKRAAGEALTLGPIKRGNMTTRQVVTAVTMRFLPSVTFMMVLLLLIEPLVRRRGVFQSLSAVYSPLVVAELLLIAGGFALCLWLVRSRLPIAVARRLWRHVVAAFIALVALGITSVFTQGAQLSFIAFASVLAGVIAASGTFGFYSLYRGAPVDSDLTGRRT